MQSTIVKWGNSQGIRLPKHLLESVNLAENDTVEITTDGDILIIRKSKPKKRHMTLKERLKGIDTSNYAWQEWDTGPAVGREALPDDGFPVAPDSLGESTN